MLIDLHRPLGSFKLQLSLLESQLNLLPEDFALICIMRYGIVPLAVLYILEFFFRQDFMIRLQLDQPFQQQQFKDLVGFGDVKPVRLLFLLPKRTHHRLLVILDPFSRCDRFLLLIRIIISRILHIIYFLLKRFLGLVGSSLSCRPACNLTDALKLL